ncbi:MAG: FHA domain-containing protein [Candidatus Competibacteraceae bacterium]
MARVRVCPTCGGENALSVIRCTQCGVSVAHISLTEAAPLALAASTEKTPAPCAKCEALIPLESAACPYCGESLGMEARLILEWPWGEGAIDRELIVGRDLDVSPLAMQLRQYGNLSRRHARLWPASDGVWIEDLGSTNGVFVNEKRLMPHQPLLLTESGLLRLAKDFVVRVRVER